MSANKKLMSMLLTALIAGAGFANAGDVVLFRQGETPAPEEIARILKGGSAPVGKTRGIKLLPDEPATPSSPAAVPHKEIERAAATAAPQRNEATSFALQVQFPFNSAQIQPDMYEALDAVAEGIKMAGAQMRLVVEGHTDSAGAVDYNLLLSRRRAEAVKNYLVSKHQLPAGNFRVIGRGKFDPLIKDDPLAPENRRVQFRLDGA